MKSVLNEKFEVTETLWVISLFNSGLGLKGWFTGHSVILVEGISNECPFIRQCDVRASPTEEVGLIGEPFKNVKGVITDIRIYESYYGEKDFHRYKEVSSRSWYRKPEEVRDMLKSIEKDKKQTEAAKRKEGDYIPYQYAGSFRSSIFSNHDEQPDNCPTWCYKKFAEAGIQIKKLPFDSVKAMPQKHVKHGAEVAEDSFENPGSCVIV